MVGKQADVYDEALPGYEGSVYQDPGIIDTIGDGGGTMDGDLGFGSLCRYFKAKLRETEDNYSASNVRTFVLHGDWILIFPSPDIHAHGRLLEEQQV